MLVQIMYVNKLTISQTNFFEKLQTLTFLKYNKNETLHCKISAKLTKKLDENFSTEAFNDFEA